MQTKRLHRRLPFHSFVGHRARLSPTNGTLGQVCAAADLGSWAADNSLDLAADPAELPRGARPSAAPWS
jgi:hypothetical protein